MSLFGYFESGNPGNPLVVLPTGSGKSIVQAEFVKRVLDRFPDERFLLLTHVKELIQQNASKIDPGLSVGVYSAGLKRRELGRSVTIAGIQSIYKRAHQVGDIGVIIIDEAHLVTKKKSTMYMSFIERLRSFCPRVRVIGMSATPFRLDSGPLISGQGRLFTDIACNVKIKTLIDDGYLAKLVGRPAVNRTSSVNVRRAGGEYVLGELQENMLRNSNIDAVLDEVEALGADRESWLVFCSGVEHARVVNDAISKRGHVSRLIHGGTSAAERDGTLSRFKEKKIKALVSVGVLTTGFDAPNADLLVCLRPTLSPGLWIQMVGRISRISPGKRDGMVLDFTDNLTTHGPIDLIEVKKNGGVKTSPFRVCHMCGELSEPGSKECSKCHNRFVKTCRECHALIDIDSTECGDCGATGRRIAARHNNTASHGAVLSDTPTEMELTEWDFAVHKKSGKPDSVKVRYWTDTSEYNEWVCPEHGGYATKSAANWWLHHQGKMPLPRTAADMISRADELTMPGAISVVKDGKYWRVLH